MSEADGISKCVICARRSEQGYACAACEARMRDRLGEVVEFYALAQNELLPGSSGGDRGTERSLGVRLSALDFVAGHDVVAVLGLWERDWRDTYGLADPKAGRGVEETLVECVKFLVAWLHRACVDHPAIDDFARELRECWSQARSAARMSPARKATTITCPADLDDGSMCECRIGVDGTDHDVVCPRCRTTWDVPHLMHVAISTPGVEMWADPAAASAYFGIAERTLRHWAERGRVQRSHGRYELHSIHHAIASERERAAI